MLKRLRRMLGAYPKRRQNDVPDFTATCTLHVIRQIERDRYHYGRRHDDLIGRARAEAEERRKRAERERQPDMFAGV